MNNNKLIAEFMGMSLMQGGWFDYKNVFGGNESYLDLKFHESWDWLMPVVEKCFEVAHDGQMIDIMHHLQVADMEEVYDAVVKFIRENTDTERMMKIRIADMDSDLN